MNANKRENPEQIPGSSNAGETAGVVSEQGGISGQRKKVNVESYEKVAELGEIFKNLQFPTDKNKIIEHLRNYSKDQQLLQKIENLENKEYKNLSEVTQSAGLVY